MPLPTDAMHTIGILGGRGMLGSDLARLLGTRYETHTIDRDNYDEYRGRQFDIVVNANGNSRRFWANEHPRDDFSLSTMSVYDSVEDFVCKKYVYISSSDVYENHASPETTREDCAIRPDKLSPYGLHKYLAEQIVRNRVSHFFILRSSMILGTHLKKGPFYDILQGSSLFIASDSCLQVISASAIARVIHLLVASDRRNEVFNMGGRSTFDFRDLSEVFKQPVAFRQDAERQVYEMNIEKLNSIYPLKTSAEYVREFFSHDENETEN